MIEKHIKIVSNTESGIELFRYIMEQCGYHSAAGTKNAVTGELNIYSLVHDNAIREIWNNLRQYIPKEALIQIELYKPDVIKVIDQRGEESHG